MEVITGIAGYVRESSVGDGSEVQFGSRQPMDGVESHSKTSMR